MIIRLILYPLAWLILLAVIWMASPAQGHTDTELAEWQDDWDTRHQHALGTLDKRGHLNATTMKRLAAERHDMQTRHPCRQTIGTWTASCEPASRPATGSPAVPGNMEAWRPLVAAHFPAGQVDRALCIIWHESRGDPSARNPTSTATGLFQILAGLWGPEYGVTRAQLEDPTLNTRIAADLHQTYGWHPWNPYRRGLCR